MTYLLSYAITDLRSAKAVIKILKARNPKLEDITIPSREVWFHLYHATKSDSFSPFLEIGGIRIYWK